MDHPVQLEILEPEPPPSPPVPLRTVPSRFVPRVVLLRPGLCRCVPNRWTGRRESASRLSACRFSVARWRSPPTAVGRRTRSRRGKPPLAPTCVPRSPRTPSATGHGSTMTASAVRSPSRRRGVGHRALVFRRRDAPYWVPTPAAVHEGIRGSSRMTESHLGASITSAQPPERRSSARGRRNHRADRIFVLDAVDAGTSPEPKQALASLPRELDVVSLVQSACPCLLLASFTTRARPDARTRSRATQTR